MTDRLFLSLASTCLLLCLGFVTIAIMAGSGVVADNWLWVSCFGQIPLIAVMLWVNDSL